MKNKLYPITYKSDVINFVFVATKTASGMDVKLDVSKNAGAITTLSATDVVDTAHPVYVNAGSNTAFTAYYKLPFNVGYLPDGLNSLSWDNLSLEYGTDPTTNLNDEIAADNILVIGNTLYTIDVEDKAYKLYNLSGAVVSEGEITGTSVFLDVPKGLYIVKIGSTSKKVMIK